MIKTLSSFQYQSFKTTHGDPKERERSNVGKNNERERYAAGWRSIQSGITYDFEGFKLCSIENNDIGEVSVLLTLTAPVVLFCLTSAI